MEEKEWNELFERWKSNIDFLKGYEAAMKKVIPEMETIERAIQKEKPCFQWKQLEEIKLDLKRVSFAVGAL